MIARASHRPVTLCRSAIREIERTTMIARASHRPVTLCRSAIRYFSTRREYEDEHHLARALSKNTLDPSVIEKYKSRVRKKKWQIPPYELARQAGYELDALEQIHKRSFSANVLLEVRDVRLPASSHHPSFTRLAAHRLHLICYTHADMIDSETRDRVEDWTTWSWPDSRSIFVDTREHRPDLHFDILYDSLLQHLENRGGINSALTVGVANTGKSSLLMALLRTAKARGAIPKTVRRVVSTGKNKRKLGKSQPIGITDKPGKTREITEYLLREKPRAFFLDVPGMTPPPFFFEERPESWFAYGAANLLPLSLPMENDVSVRLSFCDYVLHAMNRDGVFLYVKKLGLKEPTADIREVLENVPVRPFRGKDSYDDSELTMKRCLNFLKLFNTGNFGPVILDDISRRYEKFVFKDSHFTRNNRNSGTFNKNNRRNNNRDEEPNSFRDDDFTF